MPTGDSIILVAVRRSKQIQSRIEDTMVVETTVDGANHNEFRD